METFRCPTCLGVLHDAQAQRCAACGQNLRRKKPKVLGDEHRMGAVRLPIDRWMLARLNDSDVMIVPSLAWHGKFSTTPMAAPDFAATPSQVEAPIEMTAVVVESLDGEPALADPEPLAEPEALVLEPEAGLLEPTVAALALDQYTGTTTAPPVAEPEPEPEAQPEPAVLAATEAATEAEAEDEPVPAAVTPSPAPPKPAQELDPDVRALVDELYQQARAELAGEAGEGAGTEPRAYVPRSARPSSAPQPWTSPAGSWVPTGTTNENAPRASFND